MPAPPLRTARSATTLTDCGTHISLTAQYSIGAVVTAAIIIIIIVVVVVVVVVAMTAIATV